MLENDVKLWRMNVKTDSKDHREFEFCLEHNILGAGWILEDEKGNPIVPADIEECERLGREKYHSRGFSTAIHALREMNPNDLVWTRHDGIYYLCRVLSNWKYNCSEQNRKEDVINYVDVEFAQIGTVENVPGKVTNCFRAPSAVQRIYDESRSILNISKKMYNEKIGKQVYKIMPDDRNTIFDILQAEDVEEVVSLYLQVEKDYLVYTSTNKLDTQKYEFVGVARDGSHKIYPQVKTGHETLNGNDYRDLVVNGKDKVFLFAVSQNYMNVDGNRIVGISKDELINFLYRNEKIMPERIRTWM